jgi:F-type H+-transporting ATPase subunit b
MISVDGSVVIQIINFIFLIIVLNILVYKPIRNVLAQRKEKIRGLENGIETFQSDAREKDEAYHTGIKSARIKGLNQKESMLQAAAEEEKVMIEKIHTKAKAESETNRDKIAKEAAQVSKSLQKEIDTFADAICQKILGRAV